MANAFTRTSGWRFGGGNQKALLIVEGTLVIDTAGGDTALDLPASLFGLQKIIGPSVFTVSTDNKAYFGIPDTAGASVLIGEVSSGTLIDLPTATYKAYVQGYA